ncbi:MAG: DsrE family protein [Candidatus Tectomicrobia bacterium]|uniref:DsrE family protein n=1 Tax=Tectimicrobiota bacterium TaxID=2528274 RepID=A0A932FU67_UNCTE|nr:DsrE family protein [Candidatus Tectomicrobia bacterium]
MEKEKLVILLTTSPEHENTHTVTQLAQAALALGKEVAIFLMCDGAYNLNLPSFCALHQEGAEITLCSLNASQRKITFPWPEASGSQYDLAEWAHECGRFLAFT